MFVKLIDVCPSPVLGGILLWARTMSYLSGPPVDGYLGYSQKSCSCEHSYSLCGSADTWVFLGYVPGSGIAGSRSLPVSTYSRSCRTLSIPTRNRRVRMTPHPHEQLVLFFIGKELVLLTW